MKHNMLRLSGASALALLAASGFAQTATDTVKKEDVKTWVLTSAGKEYEARPATVTFSGSTGLFNLSSAYTVAKGKTSFSLYRSNIDRNPKDLDASTIGLSLGYGLTDKVELFGTFGIQRNDVDKLTDGAIHQEIGKALLYRVVSTTRNLALGYALTGSGSATFAFISSLFAGGLPPSLFQPRSGPSPPQ